MTPAIELREERTPRGLARVVLKEDRHAERTADELQEELASIGGCAVAGGGERRPEPARYRHLRKRSWDRYALGVCGPHGHHHADSMKSEIASGAEHVPPPAAILYSTG